MRNDLLYKKLGMIQIKVTQCDPKKFLNLCMNNQIELFEMKVTRNEIVAHISKYDFGKFRKLRRNEKLKVELIGRTGWLRLKHGIMENKYVILSIFIGYVYLVFLTNFIYDVKIIHENKEMRTLVKDEMEKYDLKKFWFKKSYEEIERIEAKIVNDNKDKIEWIEITAVGTKYIVNIEEKKRIKIDNVCIDSNIVAKYNARVDKIFASKGEILVDRSQNVNKGDILISGAIMKDELIVGYTCAKGEVYGEVWELKKITLPLSYKIEKPTKEYYNAYEIEFLDKKFNLWNFSKFKHYKSNYKTLLYSPFIPFRVVKETQNKVNVDSETYNFSDAIVKANELAHEEMLKGLEKDEKILDEKIMQISYDNNSITMEIYFSLYKNIGETQSIIKGEQ